uniref:Uncharacterized protein n=1 Tax=Sipha flava TaxID=143950 RepID=A0A2S2R9G4_9HEMI
MNIPVHELSTSVTRPITSYYVSTRELHGYRRTARFTGRKQRTGHVPIALWSTGRSSRGQRLVASDGSFVVPADLAGGGRREVEMRLNLAGELRFGYRNRRGL